MAGMQERFAAGLTPLPTAARVSRARAGLRWRIGTTVVSVALLIAFYFFWGRDLSSSWLIGFAVLWLGSSAFWLAVSAWQLHSSKQDLASIQEGVAFYLDPRGIELVYPHAAVLPWSEVTALKLVGRNRGPGPKVVIEARGESHASVPLSFLDAAPEVIDSAVQAYSLGRVRLDTAALDSIF